jgi:DNA-binding CsgD family transcriptional regulator
MSRSLQRGHRAMAERRKTADPPHINLIQGGRTAMPAQGALPRISAVLPPRDVPITEAELSRLISFSPLAIFLVDPQARIRYRNARAEQLLAQGGVVSCVSGKLVLNAPGAPRLCEILAGFAGRPASDAAQTRVALRGSNGTLWLARIGARPCSSMQDQGTVAIVLSEAVIDLESAATMVADVFALTQAERRALPALLKLGRVRQVAHAFGVSVTTIRSHLKSIYAKTATKRRNELFKLVARFAAVGVI